MAQAFDRREWTLERLITEMRADRAAAQAHEEQMMRRFERSEKSFIGAISDIRSNIQRSTARLEDIGAGLREVRDSIRADTEAIFARIADLGPAPG